MCIFASGTALRDARGISLSIHAVCEEVERPCLDTGSSLPAAERLISRTSPELQPQQDKGLLLPFILKYCLIVWELYFFGDSATSGKGAVTR